MTTRTRRKKSSRRSGSKRRTRFGHGWIPDRPDSRDFSFVPDKEILSALPPETDLRSHCPRVYYQGHFQTCTAHAIAAAIRFDEKKQSTLERKKKGRRS